LREAKAKGALEFDDKGAVVVRSKLGASTTTEEVHTDMHSHSNEDEWVKDAPAGYVHEPLKSAMGDDDSKDSKFIQLEAYPGIRPIGRSTVGAAGDREDEIDEFKAMVAANSHEDDWLAAAPQGGYIQNALALQLKSDIQAYPGIRPIGQSTIGAGGTRDEEIANFKDMYHANSNAEEWV
jgi:hypothetical protein